MIVFLLLSGYLITQSIRKNVERNGYFRFSEYAIARVGRIYPPFIGAVVVCATVGAIIYAFHLPGGQTPYGLPGDLFRITDHFRLSIGEVVTAFLMVGGLNDADGPLWTLFVEFQLYVTAMGVAIWFGKSRQFKPVILILAIVAAPLAFRNPMLAFVWITGALSYLFPLKTKTALLAAAAIGAVVISAAIFNPDLITAVETRDAGIVQVAIGAMLGCVIFFAWPKLNYPTWLVATGNFSYSLYVIHWPLLMLTLSLTQGWMGRSVGRASLVAVVAGSGILLISIMFAAVLERQAFYQRCLKAIFARDREAAAPTPDVSPLS